MIVTRYCSVVVALLALAASSSAFSATGQQARPNVVVILADDQGWGDLSVHGNTNLQTPQIDSLARDGALLERFFVCPVCAPTRAEFLTGRWHSRGGVHGVTTGAERLNLDERTIAEAFQAAGYACAAFGKWHNGSQWPYHPNARGFAEYYGFTSGHWGQYFDPVLEHNGQIVRGKGFIIDDLTTHALQFIEANKDRPFFCYLPYNTPHSPFQVPDRFWEKFRSDPVGMRYGGPEQEDLDTTRCVLAMCENIDWNVGRVLERLRQLNLADNTIVIYFSDNGPNSWRWNGGMKGRKGSTDEGGVRVPFLIRWPGHIPPGLRVPQIAGAVDLLPTLTSMAGIGRVGDKPLDGRDISPLLRGAATGDWADRMIFTHQNGKVSVRTQRYRLDAKGALYDMQADPGQRQDIARQQPAEAARLSAAVAAWKEEILAKAADDRPFPVGYAAFPTTPLPARDGVPGGGVQRSGRAPNCSYFTNWCKTTDQMTWDIEVTAAGQYEALIYYTCPKADVGSTVELSFQGAKVQGKVMEPFDPPLFDQSDRVSRGGESYIKDFKPLSLGTVRLEKGRGPLVLRALDVPGQQVMDVRLVTLTLLPAK